MKVCFMTHFNVHPHLIYNILSFLKCNYWEYNTRHTSEGMENNQSSPLSKLELSVTSFIGSICCKSKSIQTRGFVVYHAYKPSNKRNWMFYQGCFGIFVVFFLNTLRRTSTTNRCIKPYTNYSVSFLVCVVW